ncbi:hypothetical protein FQR65_LT17563 [Abscondita terminalis]|nr:hypothetical protein FQR65_LT17563 [Abscondita terminalis]
MPYSELNDPIDQLSVFEDQIKINGTCDDEAMFIDYDFVRSLEYGNASYSMVSKMGFTTIPALKEANPNKVFNDLGGMRKKMKLEINMPAKDEVLAWFN